MSIPTAATTSELLSSIAQGQMESIKKSSTPQPTTSETPNRGTPQPSTPANDTSSSSTSKYDDLKKLVEEMGKDIKPCYAGNKNSIERLKRHIVHARILIRECNLELDNKK
uniref:Cyclin-dependent kinase 2-associated protein 1 n=1 Tax=Parastrongyloides trichosuri TaxID=131310 RepID=A0A0N4ZPN1_PARTI